MTETICVEFPTIMDGCVLRWYADEAGYRDRKELASASRNRAVIEPDASLEVCKLADAAHDYLRDAYARTFSPYLDVSRWTTHRPASFMSHELKPLGAARTPERPPSDPTHSVEEGR